MKIEYALSFASSYPLSTALLLLLLITLQQGVQAIYRLYFHPLSKFPGPSQAAVSNNWLHKLCKDGHQEENFEKLHKQYNAHALRIGPNELHLSDVTLYKTIYSQSRPFPKEAGFYDSFNTPHTSFAELDPILHKERRRKLNPFFARSGIIKIDHVLHKHISALMRKLAVLDKQGKPIVGHNAFRCVTVDIITELAFAQSQGLVDESNDKFETDFLAAFDASLETFWDNVYSPNMRKLGNVLPKSLLASISTPLGRILQLQGYAVRSVKAYRNSPAKTNYPVIFDGLSDLSDDMVAAEAVNILIAGSDTTAYTLLTGMHRICRDQKIKQKLQAELKQAFPKPPDGFPTLPELEALPYLVACMKEALRIAMPALGRLPRMVPETGTQPLLVDDKVVPPGTTVGISAYTMHYSTELWGPTARTFDPERWLEGAGKGLDEYLVTFSKGARACIGQNLAQAEVLLMFYAIYRNFDAQIDTEHGSGDLVTKDAFSQAVQGSGLIVRMKPLEDAVVYD